jgi:hypothetical protein
MKVSDLAADLEVPPSAILEQCQRFGIDASWAGAELSGSDVVVLRAELAASDPIDLTSADAPAEVDEPAVATSDGAKGPGPEPEATIVADSPGLNAEPGAVSSAEAPDPAPSTNAMPPTAVGSMPDLIEEITPEVGPPSPGPSPSPSAAGPGPLGGSPGQHGVGVDPNATRRVAPREAPAKRKLVNESRNAVIAIVIGIACFVASNFTELPAVVALLWFLAALSFLVAVVDGLRGRRRAQVHPERYHGVWLGAISLVLAIGLLVGMTGAVLAVISDDPAADAPAGLGDLQSVQVGRWGYQRVQRLSDDGWNQPARKAGSCWVVDDKPRDEQRVELAELSDSTPCDLKHEMQVMKVFAVNRDADARYPGTAELLVLGQERCKAIADRLTKKDVDFEMKVEYPTEVGWGRADHDIACVAVTPARKGALGG